MDRISGLPDQIIHHILSFLPSTKEAIQTTVLSKRWENQWTHVSALIFDSVPAIVFDSNGMCRKSYRNFLQFISRTLFLHNCSKIHKFHLGNINLDGRDPEFDARIAFATTRHVEDLKLSSIDRYRLPKVVFGCASLVKLKTNNCTFMPTSKVNWGCLTALIMIHCEFSDQTLDHMLSSSPSLKLLSIIHCFGFQKLTIASLTLKRLDVELFDRSHIGIACPILEELEISCPIDSNVEFGNLPSSLCATLGFYPGYDQANTSEIKKILHLLQHVKKLSFKEAFSMVLVSNLDTEGWMSPMFNIKCFTLQSTMLINSNSGVSRVFHNTPQLEKLVISTPYYEEDHLLNLSDFEYNYWNSDTIVFNCLESHLKTIEFCGFIRGDDKLNFLLLNFIRFLLKNAKVLKKMVVCLEDDETGFALKVSQELSRLPRFSQDSIIEFPE